MTDKLRAWWFEKQGLAGMNGTAAETLARSGWARSVGGANPYLTLFARSGIRKAEAEQAVKDMAIHELPCARGCTHIIPAEDYALGLKVGQGTSEVASMNTAKKWLGFTAADLERLNEHILKALQKGPLDPKGIKDELGDAVVNFGEEGKKRGQTTSLSLGLGWLQAHGMIRRIPTSGRLDSQSYAYTLWNPSPLDGFAMSQEEALTELARKYFRWIGPASPANFQWFAGLGVGAAKAALEPLGLVSTEEGLLILADELDAYRAFKAPAEPIYALITSLDGLSLLRRDGEALFADEDKGRSFPDEKGVRRAGASLMDLSANAIVDRGRVVGLWEFDPDAGDIAAMLFIEKNATLNAAIERTTAFVRDELGDARSFSLDSAKSRRPKIDALRTA